MIYLVTDHTLTPAESILGWDSMSLACCAFHPVHLCHVSCFNVNMGVSQVTDLYATHAESCIPRVIKWNREKRFDH